MGTSGWVYRKVIEINKSNVISKYVTYIRVNQRMSKHMRNANERHSTYSKFVVLNLLFFDKHHKYIWLYESLNCIPIIIFLHHLYLNICVFMSLYWSGNLGISWSIFQEIPEIPGILGDSWISRMNSGNSRIYWNFRKFMYSLNSRNYCNIYTVFPWSLGDY